jgi:hypothetical protein
MHDFEILPVHPEQIPYTRRCSIGAQVIACDFMSEASILLEGVQMKSPFDISAKKLSTLISEEEYRLAQDRVVHATPDSNMHIAATHMGIASHMVYDSYGNKKQFANNDFIVATQYLADDDYADTIERHIGLRTLLRNNRGAMKQHYSERVRPAISIMGGSFDLREAVFYTVRDSQYWLEEL